jgi:hypothetical protein
MPLHARRSLIPNASRRWTTEIWERDGWLKSLARYLVTRRDDKKKITNIIFPRYHQVDATRIMLADLMVTLAYMAAGADRDTIPPELIALETGRAN